MAQVRAAASGLPDVGIGNGFASQSPFWSGSGSPVGLTAIDKHPYAGWRSFPADAQVNGNRPLNGLGEPTGWQDQEFQYHETSTPSYDSFFPEFFLSGIQTETLVRDLAPYPSSVGATEHGRFTHPDGGEPPQVWITEVNLGPGSGPTPRSQMSAAELRHVESKEILRYLVAYVNKGVTAIDFYAAQAGDLSLVDPAFFSTLKADPSAYPGDAAGGETVAAVRRLVAAMQGTAPLTAPRRLALRELTDFEGNVQFEGDGSAAFPPLYNRDVFAFFPFQVSDNRFVVPVYVMSRNVAALHQPAAPGDSRFDLPPEPYRLAIAGIDGETATVSAEDPLSGSSVPVEVVSRGSDEIVVQLPVTDSPRLLSIEDHGCEGCLPEEEPEAVGPGPEPPPTGAPGGEGAEPDGAAERPASAGGKTRRAPAPEPAAAVKVAPRLDLRGEARLLSGRAMTVLARCAAECRLRLRGRLLVDGVSYRLAIARRGEVGNGGRAAVRLRAGLAPRVARLGLRARRRGGRVKLIVAARARPLAPGPEADAREVIVLGA